MANPKFQYRLNPKYIDMAEYLMEKYGMTQSQLVTFLIHQQFNIEKNKDFGEFFEKIHSKYLA